MLRNYILAAAMLAAGANADFAKWQALAGALSYTVAQTDVTTEDNYVLTMIHITPKVDNGALPVLLMHGSRSSSDSFVDAFLTNPQDSIPFQLAAAGYHVYLGNTRGTKDYSSHTTLAKTNPLFYAYSFQEMGDYDVPAFANAIKTERSTEKITYIGNSQGSNQALSGQIRVPAFYEATFDKVIHLAGCGYSPTPDYATLLGALSPLLTSRPDIQYLYGPDWGNLQAEICAIEGMATACAAFPDLQPVPAPLTNYYEPLTLSTIFHYAQNYNLKQFASRYDPVTQWNGASNVGTALEYSDIDTVPQYVFAAGNENDERCPLELTQQLYDGIAAPKALWSYDVSEHNDFVLKPEMTMSDILDVLGAPEGVILQKGHLLDVANSTKIIGRISWQYFFDPWVDSQFASSVDVDQHPCQFEWKTGMPFESAGDMRKAIHISHNCPKALVESITFTTTLTDGDSLTVLQHTEPSTVALGSNQYLTTLSQPKTAAGSGSRNDDAFLLGTEEPEYTYTYAFTLA